MTEHPSKRFRLTVGFVPLTDCAPLAVAREKGFFADEGLEVALSRHGSWAAIRDRLVMGALDAAQMLGPMPLALTFGLEALEKPVVAAFGFGYGGNAITVSNALFERLRAQDPEAGQRPISARSLKAVIDADRAAGRPRLAFASVYPFSEHAYMLRRWLTSAEIDPDADLTLTVTPPPRMAAALGEGLIDGCCVGEPWNAWAAAAGVGHILVAGRELEKNPPGKVLGTTRAWAENNPAAHGALIRALTRAAAWIDQPENRMETARILCAPDCLNAPLEVVAASLTGRCGRRTPTDFHVFHRNEASVPSIDHAVRLLTEMTRCGQLPKDHPIQSDLTAAARTVYRPDINKESELGTPPHMRSEESGGKIM